MKSLVTVVAMAMAGWPGLLAGSAAAAPVELENDVCGLRADGGRVTIVDRSGRDLIRMDGLHLTWSPPKTDGGEAVLTEPGRRLRVDYRMRDDATGKVKLYGEFTLNGNRIEAVYRLTAPAGVKTGGAMEVRNGVGLTGEARLLKAGLWQRHPGGGMAVETNDGVFRRFDTPTATVLERFGGSPAWFSNRSQHLRFEPTGKPEEYRAETVFCVLPAGLDDAEAAAAFHGRPLAVSLSSNQPFNFSMDGASPVRLTAAVGNAGAAEVAGAELALTVRDFDGKVVAEKAARIELKPAARYRAELAVPPVPGAYFAEAAVRYAGREYLARTSLGVVAPYRFAHLDKSIFGIAAYWEIQGHERINALLRRMGVRWVRRGDTRKTLPEIGALSNWHSNVRPEQWSREPAKRLDWMRRELAECDRRRNPFWEFGNEWNMSGRGTGKFADVYVNDWLKPLARLRAEGKYKVELLSMGLAGADLKFLQGIYDHGGWPLLAGVAFHPGRGNFTPDYEGQGWTYLGSIRAMKNAMAKYGDKPLWITEAYACTLPHSWWHDSWRRAAENVVLTYVIGLAEGIRAVMFYQMYDSTWHNHGGIDLKDHEYYYGLLDRNGAVKPSLLAYCAVSEALDGATFRRYLSFEDQKMKGVEFDTPRGPLAVLWHRADGFVQSSKSVRFVTPEPWQEHWKSKVRKRFPAAGTAVTVIDCVGRKREIPVADGDVSLEMTGAPLMIYGLNLK